MFAMSAKLVPVWSVTIPPSGIGVPVAATPGLVPHDEVLTAPAEPEVAGAALVGEVPPPALVVLELELHPARTPTAITAKAAIRGRGPRNDCLFMCSAFSSLTANNSERTVALRF